MANSLSSTVVFVTPAIILGRVIIAEAKIMGITPPPFTLIGKYVEEPP